jgi:hypothetical protein
LREKHRLSVFESRVLRKIFGYKRVDVTGRVENFNVDRHDHYSSPNDIRAIKSRIMRWVGNIARMGRAVLCAVFGWET